MLVELTRDEAAVAAWSLRATSTLMGAEPRREAALRKLEDALELDNPDMLVEQAEKGQ